MASIDIDTVLTLSHLSITDDRKTAFSQQLDKILDYMGVLNNVTEVPHPDYEWPINKAVVSREDVPVAFAHDLVQKNAPDFKNGGFKVPKII